MSPKRESIVKHLAGLLRKERISQGLSMSEVAARAGIDRTMVMRVEQCERTPTIDTLLRMAEALSVNLATLLHRATKAAGD